MKNSHLTLRLPAELARALARKARALGVPKSQMAREAVARYLLPIAGEGRPERRLSAKELARRWSAMPRLSPDEAEAFARDLEVGRDVLPPISSPWE
jgi:hypothetical protein